ncbi:unnamed protein product, partial [Closterium sp. Naga37s-1]
MDAMRRLCAGSGAPGVTFSSVLSELRACIFVVEAEAVATAVSVLPPSSNHPTPPSAYHNNPPEAVAAAAAAAAAAAVISVPTPLPRHPPLPNQVEEGAAAVCALRPSSNYPTLSLCSTPPLPNQGAPGVTFPSVLSEMRARIDAAEAEGEVPRHFILSPAVGPEAITGSTRLKGGTATKVLLETIFSRAIARVLRLPALGSYAGVPLLLINPPPELTPDDKTSVRRAARVGWGRTEAAPAARYGDVMAAYEGAMRGVYQQLPGIVALTSLFHRSISSGGRVMYIGDDSLGLVGLIDASEQVPTFGARPGSFQCFLTSTWHRLICPLNQHTVDPLGSSAPGSSSNSSSKSRSNSSSKSRSNVRRSSSRRSKARARESQHQKISSSSSSSSSRTRVADVSAGKRSSSEASTSRGSSTSSWFFPFRAAAAAAATATATHSRSRQSTPEALRAISTDHFLHDVPPTTR